MQLLVAMDDLYYILEKGQKLGPFTADELTDRPLESSDMVLAPSFNDFKQAHVLPEFKAYFAGEGIYFPTKANTALFILRLPAHLIDFILMTFVTYSLAALIAPQYMLHLISVFNYKSFSGKDMEQVAEKYRTDLLIIQFVFFIAFTFYSAACESGRLKASLGKYLMSLAVVDELGYSVTFIQAFRRNIAKVIYVLASLFLGILAYIGYIPMFYTEKHQAPHDQLSGCFVVHKNR